MSVSQKISQPNQIHFQFLLLSLIATVIKIILISKTPEGDPVQG
jgi:hypothetical protein